MSQNPIPDPTLLPQRALETLADANTESDRVREQLDWSLGAFVAVFDDDLQEVLMVQLGDYASGRYGGRPWTLPGGAVQAGEVPSDAVCREIYEEAGLTIDRGTLRLAAWLPRPYFQGWSRTKPGELVLLFAAIGEPTDRHLRAAPPETMEATFCSFSLDSFLAVPSTGTGEHPLQPLPRHWAYWARLGQRILENQLLSPAIHVYNSKEELSLPPWTATQPAVSPLKNSDLMNRP